MTSDTPQSAPAQSDPMVGAWPDPARWGVPLSPEQDGPHWVQGRYDGARPSIAVWSAGYGEWSVFGSPVRFAPKDVVWSYLCPAASPDEIAALRRDTPAAGGGTGEGVWVPRELAEWCADEVEGRASLCLDPNYYGVLKERGADLRRAIAAAPPTPDRAPATEGGEAMREACAKAVEDMIYGGHCGEERDEARGRNRRNDVLRAVARALRALPTPADSAEVGRK